MPSDRCLVSLSVCLSCLDVTYCGQTIERIKMELGMEVGLGLGHSVLDGKPGPPTRNKGGGTAPHFSAHVCCGQRALWFKMPLGTEWGLGPGNIVLDGDPAPPPKGVQRTPSFRPMSIVAKRSPISAAAGHLLQLPVLNIAGETDYIIIRPYGSTAYVDAANCYIPSIACSVGR